MEQSIDATEGDKGRHNDLRMVRCRARLKFGVLRATYWGSGAEGRLDRKDVLLTLRGNLKEMTVIPSYEAEFYKPEDIVDMRHSNSSGAPVFLKVGKARDSVAMRAYYDRKIEDAKREASWAIRRQEECRAALTRIAAGDVVGSFPMWTK